jgi:inorganic pyrophosphatase
MARQHDAGDPYSRLDTFDPETGDANVVIETPRGSRNKFKRDETRGLFMLGGILPAGAVFPFDFGFLPGTLGEDGDALDVLLLLDDPAFVGCLVPARLIGVIEAEQTEDGRTERNDRLIAVASNSRNHRGLRELDDLDANLLDEIGHFFASYNQSKGKQFRVLGRAGSERARSLVEEGRRKAGGR